jgi:hypothetical protein
MKGNIKRLAVLVIINVIVPFIMAATVPADASGHRSLRGQYAATGGGTCFVAPLGFDNLVPIGGVFDLMTFSIEAVFTFNRDGKGNVERTCPTILLTANLFGVAYPFATIAKDSWDFTYAVEPDGSITLTQVPGSHTGGFISGPLDGIPYNNEGRNRRGTVSPDGKTIILNGGSPDFVTNSEGGPFQMICNDSAVLIWQHN